MSLIIYSVAQLTSLFGFIYIQHWLENISRRIYSTCYFVNLSCSTEKKQYISYACIIT